MAPTPTLTPVSSDEYVGSGDRNSEESIGKERLHTQGSF